MGGGGAAANKTQPTDADVDAFVAAVEPRRRREDAAALLALMRRVTGQEPVMWGPSIVGFGRFTYASASGRSGEWLAIGFSPRKAASTVYLMDGFAGREDLLARLGPHTTGASCLYLKRLADVDLEVLAELVGQSYRAVTQG